MAAEEPSSAEVPSDDAANAETETPNSGPVYKDLIILPPLQKKGTSDRNELLDAVPLPPIRAEEPVSSIRAALSEVCGYAHLTNYRFCLEEPLDTSQSKSEQAKPFVVSPYTGPNAVVSVPTAVKSLEKEPQGVSTQYDALVLDDYGDLTPLMEAGLQNGSAFRIVLERYDAASVRDHVTRLRSLLDGNAPSTTTLDEGSETREEASPPAKGEKTDETNVESKPSSEQNGEHQNAPSDANDAKTDLPSENNPANENKQDESLVEAQETSLDKEAEEARAPPKDMPKYPLEQPVAVDGNDLKNFYYLVCGEDQTLYSIETPNSPSNGSKKESGTKSKKKAKKAGDKFKVDQETEKDEPPLEQVVRKTIMALNEAEEKTRIKCTIRLSGFHPPPQGRKLMGDLAYYEVSVEGEEAPIHITAVPTGFYVNRSSSKNGVYHFDPSPAAKPCFSHELLDCLLQSSDAFANAWQYAVSASKERAELMATLNKDGPFSSLLRVAIRGDFPGYKHSSTASAAEGIDALLQCPSWLVPIPRGETKSSDSWTRNASHVYNPSRTEDSISDSFGVDIRSGAVRDWNEELQSAREMPVESLQERIGRARVMNKVLIDFGEASVLGVKAICDGQIAPMNPNETTRSQVYLHNSIFFSRAVDAGVETFKIAKGDRAARKSASRDVHCLGALHRMERSGLHTLATVLVDYLGTRFVCQSILPGILSGEKTHTLLYGAVEAGSPLMWDAEMHELLENTLGKSLMIATRPLPREPLTEERASEIEQVKIASPLYIEKRPSEENKEEKEDAAPTITVCAPIEAKGIRGSDQRKYVLDMTRLTPRDANWVAEEKGGTGKWESILKSNGSNSKGSACIPKDLDDDEWTLAVLRPELITNFTQISMTKYLAQKKEKEVEEAGKSSADKSSDDKGDEPKSEESVAEKPGESTAEKSETTPAETQKEQTEQEVSETEKEKIQKEKEAKLSKTALTAEDLEHLKSLRFNVNVFLPDIKSLEGIDDSAVEQIKKDEEMVRNAAKFLWDEAIPRITKEVREGSGHQMPQDGKSLTEFIHQHGVNCRYLGKLAMLAQEEEAKDKKQLEDMKQAKTPTRLGRRVMPRYWLELLECEIVARAAKHVLDGYLTENGGTAAASPAQTVASFLCALVSEGEETAAQTETRMSKQSEVSEPDEDDFNALTICDTGGNGDAVPASIRGRSEVWSDIESEVGRRFRYSLSLYNSSSKSGRALYVPLLRRVCQRTGVRLVAKDYAVGGKCLCSGGTTAGGRMTASYPIRPTDIVDIVPLMKHSAAHGEGFVPCGLGASVGLPPLHISLQDARATLEAAHLHHSARSLSRALDLAQEACSLYQRVTETPVHPGVVRCIDLMATILFDAGEPALAAANAVKALGLLVQIGGFDSPDVIGAHLGLFQMLLTAGQMSRSLKHLRAAIYLMEVLGGPRNVELSNAYHKLGTLYHGVSDPLTALRFYQEAATRECCDRLLEGMISKSTAMVLAGVGEYKLAVENEKRAFRMFSALLGDNHTLTKTSDQALKKFMKMAVEHGSKMVEDMKKRQEEAAADLIASEIEAAEAAEEEKKNKKNKKKKGKK